METHLALVAPDSECRMRVRQQIAATWTSTVISESNGGHGLKKIVRPVAQNIEFQALL